MLKLKGYKLYNMSIFLIKKITGILKQEKTPHPTTWSTIAPSGTVSIGPKQGPSDVKLSNLFMLEKNQMPFHGTSD